jgi:glycine cleavage system T protein
VPEPVQSPLADLDISQGATLGEYHGALVPARFSNPAEEHQAVRKAAGLFDFSFRARFALRGQDRVRFLHRIVSNDVKNLTPGQGTYATLLTAQGHIVADFQIACEEAALVIETDADLRNKTTQAIQRYIIGDRVQIEPLELFALAIQGPRSRSTIEQALKAKLPDLAEYGHVRCEFAGHPVTVMRASSTGEEGYEVWAGTEGVKTIWESIRGLSSTGELLCCGTEALETLRIEAGVPRYGPDFGEDTLPLEAGLLNALSFTKGCYIGQEIVERTRSRGHVNWNLVGFFVEADRPPLPGEKLVSEGKEIGEITSACVSPTLSKTIALGYARREVSQPGTKLALTSGAAVEVAALPFYQASFATNG